MLQIRKLQIELNKTKSSQNCPHWGRNAPIWNFSPQNAPIWKKVWNIFRPTWPWKCVTWLKFQIFHASLSLAFHAFNFHTSFHASTGIVRKYFICIGAFLPQWGQFGNFPAKSLPPCQQNIQLALAYVPAMWSTSVLILLSFEKLPCPSAHQTNHFLRKIIEMF